MEPLRVEKRSSLHECCLTPGLAEADRVPRDLSVASLQRRTVVDWEVYTDCQFPGTDFVGVADTVPPVVYTAPRQCNETRPAQPRAPRFRTSCKAVVA